MTAAQPYEELTDEEVVALFEEQKFPLVDNLPCSGVVWVGCARYSCPAVGDKSINQSINGSTLARG
jgi:hypothetical protein